MTDNTSLSYEDIVRDDEFNRRSRHTGIEKSVLLQIDEKCGLLNGALAHRMCQRGHDLINHQER